MINENTYPRIKNAVVLCVLFVVFQGALGLILGVIQVASGIAAGSSAYGAALIIVQLLSFVLVFLIAARKSQAGLSELFRFKAVPAAAWGAAVLIAVGFVIVCSEIDNLMNLILPMPAFLQDIFGDMFAGDSIVIALILIGLIPGFAEEMLFRGVILRGFSRNYSARKAVIVSAVLFGLVHLNPWQFVTAFIIGIVVGWICLRTESIVLCVFIHIFNNTVYLLAARFSDVFTIRGFNTNFSTPMEFQPLWFDLVGILLAAGGILLFHRLTRKTPA